jgi:hypothetical protein
MTAIISVNSVNQVIFVVEAYCVSIEVETENLDIHTTADYSWKEGI